MSTSPYDDSPPSENNFLHPLNDKRRFLALFLYGSASFMQVKYYQ